MGIGIICILISFFLKDNTSKIEKEVEDLSINIFQETNSLKRRLKLVEEELLVDHSFQVKAPSRPAHNSSDTAYIQKEALQTQSKQDPMTTFQQIAAQVKAQQAIQTEKPIYTPPTAPLKAEQKPINSILVNQVLELNKQGLEIDEICRLSTLSKDQVHTIIASNGGM